MKPHFELRRVRDFGEVINDSFTFLKDNFKALFKPLLVICGFFLVLSVIGHMIMHSGMMGILSRKGMMDPDQAANSVFDIYKGMGYYYAGILPFILSIGLVTHSYIAISLEKQDNEKPSLEEVWGYFKYYFFRCLGAFIVILILNFAGTMLCFLPGIYLMPVLSLIMPIIIIENTNFGYAFGQSFKLIKGNWWFTFGILIIMFIIVGVAGSIASIPISLLTSFNVFMGLSEGIIYPVMGVLSTIMHAIMLIGYSLVAIAIALCYFSYSEQKESTGLMDRINQLGNNNDDPSHLPTEQY